MTRRERLLLLAVAGGAAGAAAAWRRLRFMDVRGRVALVTGGSRGLGYLLARELLRRGAHVAICARDPDELDAAVRRLDEAGGSVLGVEADVSVRGSVDALVRSVEERWGPVEILVNNAGVMDVGPVGTMNESDFRRVMDINFGGALNTILAVMPAMMERQAGRIVNITSIGGRVSVPHLLPYSCAKFATMGLSEGLRAELARDGIAVTTVVPGLMRTGSPVNASFRGRADQEYAWFAASSSSLLSSMSAERAARRIVRAIERGEAMLTLTWQARLLSLAHGLAPGFVDDALGWVNRLLPDGGDGERPVRGGSITVPPAVARLTKRMRSAALRNNEVRLQGIAPPQG